MGGLSVPPWTVVSVVVFSFDPIITVTVFVVLMCSFHLEINIAECYIWKLFFLPFEFSPLSDEKCLMTWKCSLCKAHSCIKRHGYVCPSSKDTPNSSLVPQTSPTDDKIRPLSVQNVAVYALHTSLHCHCKACTGGSWEVSLESWCARCMLICSF